LRDCELFSHGLQEKRTTRKRLRYIGKTHFPTSEAGIWRELIGFVAARLMKPSDVPA
jgi:hypothetical protein